MELTRIRAPERNEEKEYECRADTAEGTWNVKTGFFWFQRGRSILVILLGGRGEEDCVFIYPLRGRVLHANRKKTAQHTTRR